MTQGYLNPMRGAVRVELADGYWVLLRHLRFEENDELEKITEGTEKTIAALSACVLDWNLDDESGTKIALEEAGRVFRVMPQGDLLLLTTAFATNEGVEEEDLKEIREARIQSRARFRTGPTNSYHPEPTGTISAPGVSATPSAVDPPGPST